MSNEQPPPAPPEPSRNNVGVILVIAAVVVAVVVGFVAIGTLASGGSSAATPPQQVASNPEPSQSPAGHTVQPTENAQPTQPTQSPTQNASSLHCTKPPAIPEHPQQFSKAPPKSTAKDSTWRVTLTTNCGDIVMDLDGKAAPQTVSSFLFLSQKGFFDDTKCHRLTTSGLWVLQCGDPTGSGSGGPGYGYGIENAPADGKYPTGTVAMARSADPNSNGSQFFIVYEDTTLPTEGGGYSIFGTVVQGIDIVQAIAAQGLAPDGTAPAQPVSILHVSAVKQ